MLCTDTDTSQVTTQAGDPQACTPRKHMPSHFQAGWAHDAHAVTPPPLPPCCHTKPAGVTDAITSATYSSTPGTNIWVGVAPLVVHARGNVLDCTVHLTAWHQCWQRALPLVRLPRLVLPVPLRCCKDVARPHRAEHEHYKVTWHYSNMNRTGWSWSTLSTTPSQHTESCTFARRLGLCCSCSVQADQGLSDVQSCCTLQAPADAALLPHEPRSQHFLCPHPMWPPECCHLSPAQYISSTERQGS
jgi:hypothetical protein